MSMNFQNDSLDTLVFKTIRGISSLDEKNLTEEQVSEITNTTALQTAQYEMNAFVQGIVDKHELFAMYDNGIVTVVNAKLTPVFEGKFREFLSKFD